MDEQNTNSSSKNEENADKTQEKALAMDNFTKEGFPVLMEAIRNANSLPTDKDWNYYNVYESFKNSMSREGDHILHLMNNILKCYDMRENVHNRTSEDKIEIIVEANDAILEKVANNIDEMNGIKKNGVEPVLFQTVSAELPINGSWNRMSSAKFSVDSGTPSPAKSFNTVTLLTGKNIIRPQNFFKGKIDNSIERPWEPLITEKPNSLKPLAIFLEESEFGPIFCHPYEFELDRFNPPPEQLTEVKLVFPKALSDTPLHKIETPEKLNELVEELRNHNEIAVDLEHHSYRSFLGITCLMQISTKDGDYIIDTLALRDKLCILNEVFTKPTIVKIFHGADQDVEWLQKDLSLYIVNMFDTHQAAKQLQYSGLSLAFLLQQFCNVSPNKHFQLADWRIRPLPAELLLYARMDTHYLIYIYHKLRNELLKLGNGNDNVLKAVIQKSTEICLKRYRKPPFNEDTHLDFYHKCKRSFDNRQMHALKELFCWRNTVARQEDESTGYVLPNHMLLQISELLPREMQGILACCNPIPPLVKSCLLELHKIILKAREQPIVKPILKEDNRSRGNTLQFAKINLESPLHCPQELSKSHELRDDLPTLLGNQIEDSKKNIKNILEIEKEVSSISVFNLTDQEVNQNEAVQQLKKFLGPYERYKLVKPYIEAQENEEKETDEVKVMEENETVAKPPTKASSSNEDRISALHGHFMKLSQTIPQEPLAGGSSEPEEVSSRKFKKPREMQSLLEMGGTKRKRNLVDESDKMSLSYERPENQIQTPVPNFRGFKNDSANKRRRRGNAGNTPKRIKFDDGQEDPNQKPLSSRQKKRNWYLNSIQRGQRNRQQKRSLTGQMNQDRSTFQPYDYSQVNLQQFQGGAGRVNNSLQVKCDHKPKGDRHFKRKGNNKSVTFEMNKNNRKGKR